MTTIVLRAVKGDLLTNAEVDANFSNLNNDKLEVSAYTANDVLAKLLTVDGTGSGLDADLLDGQSAAYYTDIVSRLGYTPLDAAGGTVGGALTVNGALDVNGNITGYGITAEGGSVAGVTAGFYANFASAPTTYQLYLNGTAPSYFGGNVGIRSLPVADSSLLVTAPFGTAVTQNAIYINTTFPSTTTSAGRGIFSQLATAAASFTISSVVHFSASTITKGAGSTITSAYGFAASQLLAVGTNNYGFWSDIPSAANTWQLYMSGTAQSYFGGPVGILQNDPIGAGVSLLSVGSSVVNHPVTGTYVIGVNTAYLAPSTATGTQTGFHSYLGTANSAFTVASQVHFHAYQSVKAALATITNVFGFHASNAIAVGTNNYGFYSTIAAATNTYQLYMGGTASSYFGGPVGLLAATSAQSMAVGGNVPTTNADSQAIAVNVVFPATTTSRGTNYYSVLQTQNSVFTMTSANHFAAVSTSRGASSTITGVYGFRAYNAIAVGTNNYGFYSDIAAATNTYQLYMAGTAASYINGNVGIRQLPGSDVSLRVQASTGTGVNLDCVLVDGASPSTATTYSRAFHSQITSAASAYTLSYLYHFLAEGAAKGAGSTITSVYGFLAANAIAVGTNNYGFYSDINNAANTYQLYMGGTASNYINGLVGFGTTPLTSYVVLLQPQAVASASSSYSMGIVGQIPSTATTTWGSIISNITTPAAVAYTSIIHFRAYQTSIGAGGSAADVRGFSVDNTIAHALATSVYAFFSTVNNASGTYQLYMSGSAPNFVNGVIGLGGATPSPTAIVVNTAIPSTINATTIGGFSFAGTVPSTTTGTAYGYYSTATTAAVAFTLSILNHFAAIGAAKGAGSTITNVYGFRATNTIVQGTNNYGFFSDINDAANTYQLYMLGTAQSYFGGAVGILNGSPLTGGAQLFIGGTNQVTGVSAYSVCANQTFPSTATTRGIGFLASLLSAAASYTVTELTGFKAGTFTKGASSTITNAYGFVAENALAVATNNYGFYSNINSNTNTWQLYMGGTAPSYFGGGVGVYAGSLTDSFLYVGGASTHIFSVATTIGIKVDYTAPTSTTTISHGVMTLLRTAAAAYTLTSMRHFSAENAVKGAGSTITNVYGFMARNAIAVGDNNYGFYSDINAAANTYQLYMAGTAISSFIGPVQIGAFASANYDALLRVGIANTHPSTATSVHGIHISYVAPSTATSNLYGIWSTLATAASVFTAANVNHFSAAVTTKGAGSTITTVRGFYAASTIVNDTAASTTYGFYSDINKPTSATAYQLHMGGTADSLFAGRLIMSGSNARLLQAQGAAVASANNLALGADGNRFQISGTTQINLIDNSNWQGGAIVVLHFQGAVTVKHNQAASGNNKPIMLSGAADMSATADDQLVLQYDSTASKWYEISRAVI